MDAQRSDSPFVAPFAVLPPDLTAGPAWLSALRTRALAAFVAQGLPTVRQEAWKYTNLSALAKQVFPPAPAPHGTDAAVAKALVAHRLGGTTTLVFVDGHFLPALSDPVEVPSGVTIANLQQTWQEGENDVQGYLAQAIEASSALNAFGALNGAWMRDGALLVVAEGVTLTRPIHALFVSTGQRAATTNPRVLIRIDRGAQATVIESYVGLGDSAYLTNAVSDVALGQEASLEHLRVQQEGAQAFFVGQLAVKQAAQSRLRALSIALGGALARSEVRVCLAGEGATCTLNGLYVASGRQHSDTQTWVDHAAPRCSSDELYKGVLADHAVGVFGGTVHVRPGAQQTDAKQSNKNLLLSPDAVINSKPQLEIFADDVKCTHAATIGQIDADALFYLRSRGIDDAQARRLLVYAFAGDVIRQLPLPLLADNIEAILKQRLPTGAPVG